MFQPLHMCWGLLKSCPTWISSGNHALKLPFGPGKAWSIPMKHLILCSSLLVAAVAAPAIGGAPAAEAQSSRTPTKAAQFVPMAASSDLYEIESSRLALERSQSPAIKQFAQMMIDHHTMTTQQ